MKRTEITDPASIDVLCRMQQQFVEQWNAAEATGFHPVTGEEQNHALPGGATYTSSKPARGASFALPDGTWLVIAARAPWWHWHDGWSFCRNPLTVEQVRKAVVHGSMAAFEQWFATVLQEAS